MHQSTLIQSVRNTIDAGSRRRESVGQADMQRHTSRLLVRHGGSRQSADGHRGRVLSLSCRYLGCSSLGSPASGSPTGMQRATSHGGIEMK
jgi:hypothetical protein